MVCVNALFQELIKINYTSLSPVPSLLLPPHSPRKGILELYPCRRPNFDISLTFLTSCARAFECSEMWPPDSFISGEERDEPDDAIGGFPGTFTVGLHFSCSDRTDDTSVAGLRALSRRSRKPNPAIHIDASRNPDVHAFTFSTGSGVGQRSGDSRCVHSQPYCGA